MLLTTCGHPKYIMISLLLEVGKKVFLIAKLALLFLNIYAYITVCGIFDLEKYYQPECPEVLGSFTSRVLGMQPPLNHIA